MNIEGLNLVSLSPGKSPIEGDVLSLPENGVIPEDFANALRGLLSETSGQAERPCPLSGMAVPQPISDPHEIGDLQKDADAQKELVALFEQYLPMPYASYKENEGADLEAALLALTEGLTTAAAPSIPPEDVTVTQDMGGAMALNGLAFVKPVPEEAKLDISGENGASVGYLQKETVLRQSTQGEQGVALQPLESMKNAEPVKQSLTFENQLSLAGLEKTAPEVTTDMLPAQRPLDNRTDSLAITKPLTHPGWGKDLGEQIVWMNNKEISAAEIRLNPANLGPISVRIDVDQDQRTTIMFTAQHLETKEAIEASLPKLREMLVTHQLNLVNVNISQNSTPDQGRPHPHPFHKMAENHGQDVEGSANTMEKSELGQVVVGKGLLSLYA